MKYYLLMTILMVAICLPGCGKKSPPFIPEKESKPASNAVEMEVEKNHGKN